MARTDTNSINAILGKDNTFTGTNTFTQDITAPNINGAPSETITEVTSKGGLLKCIDSSTGDTPTTTSATIENSKYGWDLVVTAGTMSAEYDTVVKTTGDKTLLIQTTNTSGYGYVETNYFIPVTASKKYNLNLFLQTLTVATNGAYFSVVEYTSAFVAGTETASNKLTGTLSRTITSLEFTTGATTDYVKVRIYNGVAGNVSSVYADINSMSFDTVIETTNDTLSSKSPALVGFTTVSTTDNIDISEDELGAYTNTYTVGTSIIESATTLKNFTPTKTQLYSIGVYLTKGTGNWTLFIHNSSNVVLGYLTKTNASLVNGLNTFITPVPLTSGVTYHFHLTSTVADGTVKTNIASDLSTCSFISKYSKNTTGLGLSLHGNKLNINTNQNGFLNLSNIDLKNGKYSVFYGASNLINKNVGEYLKSQVYENTASPYWSGDILGRLRWDSGYITYKVTCPNSILNLDFSYFNINGIKVEYSYNNNNYYVLNSNTNAFNNQTIKFSIKGNGGNIVFIKFTRVSGSVQIGNLDIKANFNKNLIKNLYYYPTNKEISKVYQTTTSYTVTTVIYRSTKYGFPALEFTDGTYIPLDIDCSDSTSTIKLSELGATYTTVIDGGSLTITSTNKPIIYTKITITKNRLLVSSNNNNSSSSNIASNTITVNTKIETKGIKYSIEGLQKEMNNFMQINLFRQVHVLVTNDGTGMFNCDGTDDDEEIQQALNYVSNLGGGEIYVKYGDYYIGNTVNIPRYCGITGSGWGTEFIAKNNFTDGYMFKAYTNIDEPWNMVFRNFKINGNKLNQTNTFYGIHVNQGQENIFDKLWFQALEGVSIYYKAKKCKFTNINFGGSGSGLSLGSHALQLDTAGDIEIVGNNFHNIDVGYPIYSWGGEKISITANTIYSNLNGILVDGPGSRIIIQSNSFENITSSSNSVIRLAPTVSACNISNNTYEGYTQQHFIYIQGGSNHVINGNILSGLTRDNDTGDYAGIYLGAGTTGCSITANIFQDDELTRTFSLLTVNATSGNNSITVTDGTKFSISLPYVVLRNNAGVKELLTIQSIVGNVITFTTNLVNSYTTASVPYLILTSWYKTGIKAYNNTVKNNIITNNVCDGYYDKSIVLSAGNICRDNIERNLYDKIVGNPFINFNTPFDTSGVPLGSSGSGTPTSTPRLINDTYTDYSGKKQYVATGTSSSADWTILN